jgi:hypothetical protein
MNKVIEKASSDSDSATPGSLQGSGGGSSGISSPGGAGGISGLGASSGGPGGSSGLSGLGGIGGGGGGSSADFTGGPSVPEHQIVGFRRRIRYQLSSIQFGLKGGGELNRGVTGLTADDKRALLDSVTKNVDELLKLTESKMDLQELLVEFQKSSRRLDVLTKKAPPVDPAADPGKLPPDAGDVPDAPSLPADAGDVPPAQPKGN